jgi:type I restriction enzyme S subunit
MKWEKLKIEEIGLLTSGGTPSTGNPAYWNGEIPWITPKDLSNFEYRYIENGERNITEEGLKNSSAKLVKEKSVLLSSRAPIGYLAIAQNDVTTNQGFKNITPNDKCDYVYLFYCLKNNVEYLKSLGIGATYPELSSSRLKEIQIPIPPLPTQRKIANILSAYDDLIENNLKRVKLLEEKAFLRYKQIVREEKEIKKVSLAQLATVTSSKRIFLSDYVEEGIPFYRSKEIITKSNFESIEKPLYITEERYLEIKEKFGVPVSGDLLITSVGTIGFVHLVNDDDGDFYFKDGNLIWIKNLLQQNLAFFLFFKFRTPEFKEMLNSVAIGSSQKALTIETVKKIEIEIPSDDSLIEFNQETKTIIKFIYTLQKQNTKLREARDILLPKLMNGQIEV